MTDSIVESVLDKFKERSEEGIKKYGVTLDRKDLSPLEWLTSSSRRIDGCYVIYREVKERTRTFR